MIDKIIEELEYEKGNYEADTVEEANAIEQSFEKAIKIVKKYENDGWVLCSDRLPKIESIFCNEYKDFLIGYGYEDGGSNTGFSAESENIILMDAVAWKPLPQPYKGE